MSEQYILLVDYDNCSTEYINVDGKVDLDRKMMLLKNNSSIEHIQVVRPKFVGSWSNPNSSPEQDWF